MASISPTKSRLPWKGKAKSTEPSFDLEYEDINPVITYRHVLSQNLGVRDPLRVIGLCDLDAFYAACEMVRLGVDKEEPLVVLQWDMLIAVNYPARKYGISRMDRKKDALKKCPHVRVVHVATYKEGDSEPGYWDDVDTNTHKVSLDFYRRESMKIAAMFREGLVECEIEKASIDESFIDFTKPVREILLQRYPYLAHIPTSGSDTPLPPPPVVELGAVANVVPVYPPLEDEDSEEKLADMASGSTTVLREDPPLTWHDIALSIGAELLAKVRENVRVKLGYTTSAGIARNKFLAKLAASYKKQNTQTILKNAAIPNYLRPMKFQKIRFLGGKLGRAIAQEYDAVTVNDLLTVSLEEMQEKFGEESLWVYEFLRGIDRNEVKDKGSTLSKSMLASKNLPKPITKASEGHHWIRVLASELAVRLNDARVLSPNLWPRTIALHARTSYSYEDGRSRQAPFTFTRDVSVDVIASAGDKLWKALFGTSTNLNVTNVGLALTGISFAETGQISIEDFVKPPSVSRKRFRDADLDSEERSLAGAPSSAVDRHGDILFVCPRCRKTFRRQHLDPSVPEDLDNDYLNKMKLEHDDYHFAQSLANEGKPLSKIAVATKPKATSKTGGKTTKEVKKRKTPAPKGIEKFFRK